MKPPVETVRISQRGKEILISTKRKTGIDQWNILCRWAVCASLAVDTQPKQIKTLDDSNIEIAWKVFGGPLSDLLAALVRARKKNESRAAELSDSEYFRAHLERGIGYLQNLKSLDHLCSWKEGFNA